MRCVSSLGHRRRGPRSSSSSSSPGWAAAALRRTSASARRTSSVSAREMRSAANSASAAPGPAPSSSERDQELQPHASRSRSSSCDGRVGGDHRRQAAFGCRPADAHRLRRARRRRRSSRRCRLPRREAARPPADGRRRLAITWPPLTSARSTPRQRALRRNPQQQLVVQRHRDASRARPSVCGHQVRRWPARSGPPAPIRRSCPVVGQSAAGVALRARTSGRAATHRRSRRPWHVRARGASCIGRPSGRLTCWAR